MANIKDFIKKIGNETVSLEEQQRALAAVEQTIVEAKAKREESIGKNVDLVISALKKIESDLNTKLVELNNTPAKQGVAGPKGEKGRDGRDGKDGYAGKDGKDGLDGKDGKDGEDGISVSDAQIDFDGSLLITLSDGREIDAGTVIPLDVAKQIHSVSTNGGGTSQSVLDAITDLQTQINTLTGIDGTLGTMAQQDANAVAITGGTITNVEITSPELNQINDTNGNEILGFSPTTSATDYLVVKNGIGVGVPLHVYADGSSSNIGLHIQPKGTGLVTISDGTDFNKGIRFRSSSSAASAITLLDAVSTAGRVVTLPDATTTLVGRNTTDTLTNKTLTSPVISGGTIDSAVIGATTPAAGTFTTITGQTARLNGTGSNLLTQSNTFTNANWTKSNLSAATTVVTTDPFGGSDAYIFTADGASAPHYIAQLAFTAGPASRTWSIYLKAGTNNFAQLMFGLDANPFANFNLSTGVVGTVGTSATASMVSVGSGWYRCIVTTTSTTAGSPYVCIVASNTAVRFETNSLATTVYAYGGQYELSSTANTYISTTTTAVYGTPTLSFSGVAGLGLESNGALYVSPAGTGALQAQATTSSAVGGNARGANAVDWQTSRSNAGQVAVGQYAIISGGAFNTGSGFATVISGGTSNSGGTYGNVLGGSSNAASGAYSSITGGQSNTAAGFFNLIGGGFTNSGTSASAVTTQSGTMNATTAVTLSGSNANIKVGQLITGTSIASYTYVAAISGTSLTLSQAASGSSTSTLSFFTPHGVVVGGGNNQATGSYSFIGGGGDAGTSSNRNTASGDWSAVLGGVRNVASGVGSVVCGGGANSGGVPSNGNAASGISSFVGGGNQNSSTATYSCVLGGFGQFANGTGSSILGGYAGTTRGISGNTVFPASTIPIANASGITQAALLVFARQTTDATATVLCSDGNAASGTNQVILPNNSAYLFKATVISNVTGGGNTSGWKLEGVIKRGANAASTAIVGTVTTTLLAQDAGAATWAIAATADTTNGGLRITFTGQAATTIRTVCKVETTEVTF
jgi:hypothetical protein